MGVIAVQAGVGAHVIDKDPAEAKKSLEAIAATSRSTLTEIRRLLGVLRADEHGAYQPAPGLADLDRLVADVDGAGLPVDVDDRRRRATTCRPASTSPRTASCRRRSPTCLKHAGPAHATRRASTTSRARCASRSPTTAAASTAARPTAGTACMGMRERVGVYGGTLDAGPGAGRRLPRRRRAARTETPE